MNQRIDAYRSVQVGTSDPGKLLLMLLSGTQRELRKARESMEAGDGQWHKPLLNAHLGVVELDRTLNHEQGPQLADMLHKLYLHLLWLIGEAMEQESPASLHRAETMVDSLRQTWTEALEMQRQAAAG